MNIEKLLVESYIDELISAALYDYLKTLTKEDSLKNVFSKLAQIEKSHATLLEKILISRRVSRPRPGFVYKIRLTLYKILARTLGYKILLSLMEASEASAIKTYWMLLKESPSELEKQALENLLRDEISHEISLQESLSLYVKTLQGLKDIVYGMIDALIEIEAGVIGIASATNSPSLAGLAGLIAGFAGSFSMASGAYLSTKSEKEQQNKLVELDKIKWELGSALAESGSYSIEMKEGDNYSPWKAARNAGVFYLIGAIGPIIPFLMNLTIPLAILTSLFLSTIIITALTFVTSSLSGSSFRKSWIEYLLITYSAVTVTYLIGRVASQVFGIVV